MLRSQGVGRWNSEDRGEVERMRGCRVMSVEQLGLTDRGEISKISTTSQIAKEWDLQGIAESASLGGRETIKQLNFARNRDIRGTIEISEAKEQLRPFELQ